MTTFSQLTDEVLETLQGYGLVQPRTTYLTSPATATDLSLQVSDASDFAQGVAEIEGEVVFIDSVDTSSNLLTISPDGRGFYGTMAATHAANVRVTSAPTWPRHRVKGAINDVIAGTYPTLFGVGTTTFTYNAAQTTYEIPADAEQILSVAAGTIGPSKEPQIIRRYSFNSVAPTGTFVSGNSITLESPATPGQTVTVSYLKQPSQLVADTDDFTTSGLRLTAKPAVILGACSQLLAFLDAARLPVDTAQADQYDNRNAVGTAARLSTQLLQRYELELEKERKRLRTTTPVPINLRSR